MLPKPLESQWLSQLYLQTWNASFSRLMASPPEISSLLRALQRRSLSLSDSDHSQSLKEIDNFFDRSLPYAALAEDIEVRLAFEMAWAFSHNEGSATPDQPAQVSERAAGACLSKEIISKLPTKYGPAFLEWCATRRDVEITEAAWARTYVNGRWLAPESLPIKLKTGRYWRHRLNQHSIITESCIVQSAHESSCRELSRRVFLSSLPSSTLRKYLLASKPASVSIDGVYFIEPHHKSVIALIPSTRRKITSLPSETVSSSLESKSLWESPWLWAGVVAVAGLAGWGVYEATKVRTVETP